MVIQIVRRLQGETFFHLGVGTEHKIRQGYATKRRQGNPQCRCHGQVNRRTRVITARRRSLDSLRDSLNEGRALLSLSLSLDRLVVACARCDGLFRISHHRPTLWVAQKQGLTNCMREPKCGVVGPAGTHGEYVIVCRHDSSSVAMDNNNNNKNRDPSVAAEHVEEF